jgi:uncharacterized protein YeaO (DUF488 family)
MNIKIKRVYEWPDEEDGMRILVDRLWPRGLTKAKASVDLWLKDIAPSIELRKWFDAMWLRDSAAQVWPYLPLAKDDARLKTMLAGVVNRQARCVRIDP